MWCCTCSDITCVLRVQVRKIVRAEKMKGLDALVAKILRMEVCLFVDLFRSMGVQHDCVSEQCVAS